MDTPSWYLQRHYQPTVPARVGPFNLAAFDAAFDAAMGDWDEGYVAITDVLTRDAPPLTRVRAQSLHLSDRRSKVA